MKLSSTSLISTLFTLGFATKLAAADPTHQIVAAFNNLIFYDNEQISDPTFVDDFVNASTFALAAGASISTENNLPTTWENVYLNARDVFQNIGFVLETGPEVVSPELGLCAPCLTVGEVVGSIYDKLGGPDSQELGELLQSNNADVLDPEAVQVLDSWLGNGECFGGSDSPNAVCFEEGDYITSVTYVGESATGDMFVENYRVFLTPVPPSELLVAQPPAGVQEEEMFKVDRAIFTRWAFNQQVYGFVRDDIAAKLGNSTLVAENLVGPAFVLDRDEVPVEPFMPVELLIPNADGTCPAQDNNNNDTMTMDSNESADSGAFQQTTGALALLSIVGAFLL